MPVEPDVERIAALGFEPVRARRHRRNRDGSPRSRQARDVVLGIIDRTVAQRATLVKPASAYRRSTAYRLESSALVARLLGEREVS